MNTKGGNNNVVKEDIVIKHDARVAKETDNLSRA